MTLLPRNKFFFFAKKIVNRLFYKLERKLWKGGEIKSSDKPSILFFTIYRSGSSFVSSYLEELGRVNDYQPINFEAFLERAYPNQKESLLTSPLFWRKAFRERGMLYTPLRVMCPIHSLDKYNVLLILRDPRDVLTSLYYALLYSHEDINHFFYERKKTAKKQTIDQFVLGVFSDELLVVYENYIDNLMSEKSTLFIKYENLISDFTVQFKRICNHLNLEEDLGKVNQLIKKTSFDVSEDQTKHKRQVQVGDHKRKLKPETIEQLNVKFQKVLIKMDY